MTNESDDELVFNVVFEVDPKANSFTFSVSGSMDDVGSLETQILQKDVADQLVFAIASARKNFHRQQVADLTGEVE